MAEKRVKQWSLSSGIQAVIANIIFSNSLIYLWPISAPLIYFFEFPMAGKKYIEPLSPLHGRKSG